VKSGNYLRRPDIATTIRMLVDVGSPHQSIGRQQEHVDRLVCSKVDRVGLSKFDLGSCVQVLAWVGVVWFWVGVLNFD
jgi:hypothetical protein